MSNKCPQCGYTDEIVISKFSAVMSVYINEKGDKFCTNSDQEEVTVKGVKFVREDVYKAKQEADKLAKADAQAKVLTATPVTSVKK